MTKEEILEVLSFNDIFQRAIKRAQKRHRELGLPNVYEKNGKIVYELPDGTYTTVKPKILEGPQGK